MKLLVGKDEIKQGDRSTCVLLAPVLRSKLRVDSRSSDAEKAKWRAVGRLDLRWSKGLLVGIECSERAATDNATRLDIDGSRTKGKIGG